METSRRQATMGATRQHLAALGLPPGDPGDLPASTRRFPDGTAFRVEIPSVEGPAPFRAALAAAADHGIRFHRISRAAG